MIDVILTIIIIVCVGLGIFYIYRSKKKGKKCIGCPDAGSCNCGCSRGKE